MIWGTVVTGNTIYLNDFEITKLNDVEPEYQYFIKDHLGNVRITFTTKDEVDSATATLEDENVANEQGKFIYYDEAIRSFTPTFLTTPITALPFRPVLPGATPMPRCRIRPATLHCFVVERTNATALLNHSA